MSHAKQRGDKMDPGVIKRGLRFGCCASVFLVALGLAGCSLFSSNTRDQRTHAGSEAITTAAASSRDSLTTNSERARSSDTAHGKSDSSRAAGQSDKEMPLQRSRPPRPVGPRGSANSQFQRATQRAIEDCTKSGRSLAECKEMNRKVLATLNHIHRQQANKKIKKPMEWSDHR